SVMNADGTPKWRMAPSPHGPYWKDGMKLGYQDAGSATLLKSTPLERRKAAWLYLQFIISKTVDRKSTRLNSSHVAISYAVFCLKPPAPPAIYTLSLHDALPIFGHECRRHPEMAHGSIAAWSLLEGRHEARLSGRGLRHLAQVDAARTAQGGLALSAVHHLQDGRSEEHTSELQSRGHLVCRLLLEAPCTTRDLHSFPTRRSSDLRS